MRVLIAVDSFKGSLSAAEAGAAIAAGWRSARPADPVDVLPLADGGEGTADVVAAATPGAVRQVVPAVTGPDGRSTPAEWFALPGGVAVLDLARTSGLPLMAAPDAMGATTRGLGEAIRDALAHGAVEVWIGLGGSASTDGGLGALRALGLRARDGAGRDIPEGGAGLARLATVELDGIAPIPGGVTLLTDVTSPLLGEHGAAAVFAPQKGATSAQVRLLERGLARLAEVLGADPSTPGSGAAGGTAYGFAAVYQAAIVSGADRVAELSRLDDRIAAADLVITGEGAFDDQSSRGKLVGNVLGRARAAGKAAAVVAGVVRADPGVAHASLVEAAGDAAASLREPARWAAAAAASLA
ncbi:MAG: glycerate kinase, partial [Microbacterium sp.]|uniref:glycerate kinase n=1 Tax=Microbacterium sp. TaxID=51671 RepID=UPI0039E67776